MFFKHDQHFITNVSLTASTRLQQPRSANINYNNAFVSMYFFLTINNIYFDFSHKLFMDLDCFFFFGSVGKWVLLLCCQSELVVVVTYINVCCTTSTSCSQSLHPFGCFSSAREWQPSAIPVRMRSILANPNSLRCHSCPISMG